jgi:hypothetical protein
MGLFLILGVAALTIVIVGPSRLRPTAIDKADATGLAGITGEREPLRPESLLTT